MKFYDHSIIHSDLHDWSREMEENRTNQMIVELKQKNINFIGTENDYDDDCV